MALKEIRYRDTIFPIAYEIVNPIQEQTILFLHGWGSDKEVMKQAFIKTLPDYRHLYIDMPGFGKSPNETVLTTNDYARIVEAFLQTLGIEPEIIAGHSFGGKVAVLLRPRCLVLLSSAGITVPKPWIVRAKIALFKTLRKLGLSKLRDIFVSNDVKGMSEAMYETFKNVVNERFDERFEGIASRTLVFWGKADSATPLWTGEKIASMIPDASFVAYEGDHYFFLKHANDIAHRIQTHCKEDK